jgi:hypothetical protein
MASDTRNVKLGVCSVSFNGVDLGYTKGGVDVEVKTTTKQVMVDQFGNSPINEYVLSRTCSAKVPLAETTLENLVKIMPGATLVTDGTTPTKKKVSVTNAVGASLLDVADELVLHPVALVSTDHTEDFTIPLAMTAGDLQYAYKLDQERVFNCTFTAYPDPVTKVLFIVGDKTATA